jgi:Recombination endonuclease VII
VETKGLEALEGKICNYCNTFKVNSDFHKCNKVKSGIRSKCKKCRLKEKLSRDYKKEYNVNPEKVKRNARRWAIMNPRRKILNNYKMTVQEYENVLKLQNYKCAICPKKMSELNKHLAVDHCHKTGKIRGLLCRKCNSGLGFFKDDPILVEKALKYLCEEQDIREKCPKNPNLIEDRI